MKKNLMMNFSRVLLFLGLSVMLACTLPVPRPSASKREAYRQTVAPVIEWLDRALAKNGRYPSELPKVQQGILNRLDVCWEYCVFNAKQGDDSTAFEISIGDYGKHGWKYCYSSLRKKWWLDD